MVYFLVYLTLSCCTARSDKFSGTASPLLYRQKLLVCGVCSTLYVKENVSKLENETIIVVND